MSKTLEIDFKRKIFENFIINGGMNFWQRGTSANLTLAGVGSTSGFGSVDRYYPFIQSAAAAMSITTSRQTDVPTGFKRSVYSARITTNTNFTVGANVNGILPLVQPIEGNMLNELADQGTVWIGFWVKSNVAIVHSSSLVIAGSQSYVWTDSIQANTWTYVKKKIKLPNVVLGRNSAAVAMYLDLGGIAGSTNVSYTSSLNQWNVGNFWAASTATNWAATSGNYVQYTGIRISQNDFDEFCYSGSNLVEEERLCYRYCWRTTAVGSPLNLVNGTFENSSLVARLQFPVKMRANPIYNSTNTTITRPQITTYAIASITTTEEAATTFGQPGIGNTFSGEAGYVGITTGGYIEFIAELG